MTLEDEDGNEVTFEVIDALDHKGVHYLAVVDTQRMKRMSTRTHSWSS